MKQTSIDKSQIGHQLSPSVVDELAEVAEERGQPLSILIDEAMEFYLANVITASEDEFANPKPLIPLADGGFECDPEDLIAQERKWMRDSIKSFAARMRVYREVLKRAVEQETRMIGPRVVLSAISDEPALLRARTLLKQCVRKPPPPEGTGPNWPTVDAVRAAVAESPDE